MTTDGAGEIIRLDGCGGHHGSAHKHPSIPLARQTPALALATAAAAMPLPRVRILAAPSVAPASYRAAPAPHHAGRAFRSPWPSAEADLPGLLGERGVLNLVRSRFGAPDVDPTLPGADAVPAVRDATFHPPPDAPPASPRDIVYTWLGHAANHIQLPTGRSNRLVVLTDPVFSHRWCVHLHCACD